MKRRTQKAHNPDREAMQVSEEASQKRRRLASWRNTIQKKRGSKISLPVISMQQEEEPE
jgi:hypothetical protein